MRIPRLSACIATLLIVSGAAAAITFGGGGGALQSDPLNPSSGDYLRTLDNHIVYYDASSGVMIDRGAAPTRNNGHLEWYSIGIRGLETASETPGGCPDGSQSCANTDSQFSVPQCAYTGPWWVNTSTYSYGKCIWYARFDGDVRGTDTFGWRVANRVIDSIGKEYAVKACVTYRQTISGANIGPADCTTASKCTVLQSIHDCVWAYQLNGTVFKDKGATNREGDVNYYHVEVTMTGDPVPFKYASGWISY
ncbi:MAG TPA: hypothetical protein VM889_00280 [Candidatus Thermoplasmatota archaeon]|nr:hypothetical protein [Candidatus Thermoplasmatota archaeon]